MDSPDFPLPPKRLFIVPAVAEWHKNLRSTVVAHEPSERVMLSPLILLIDEFERCIWLISAFVLVHFLPSW